MSLKIKIVYFVYVNGDNWQDVVCEQMNSLKSTNLYELADEILISVFSNIKKYNPISVIITSGTLHPIDSVESELKHNFPIKLCNSHVIDSKQVNFGILVNSLRRKIGFRR